jgi:hypothetical protein
VPTPEELREMLEALRGLEYARVHSVRVRVDESVRRSLEELAETVCQAVEAKDFFAELDAEAETDEQKDARERKRTAANAKRREKRNAKTSS